MTDDKLGRTVIAPRRNRRRVMVFLGVVLVGMLLTKALAGQEPVDTARATAELAISFEPGSIIVRGDTTMVYVGVTHEGDTVVVDAVDRASRALQSAILAGDKDCCRGSVPDWVWIWGLTLGSVLVIDRVFGEDQQTVINNVNEQSQEVDVTIKRRRWHWKKRHWPRHPGEEEQDDGDYEGAYEG